MDQQLTERNSTNDAPIFAIEKVYVKDLSTEVPHAPEIYLSQEAPQVDIELNTQGRSLGEGVFEAVLKVTVSAQKDDKVYFLVEVSQAGVFRIVNVPDTQVEPLLAVACPGILFPYAREAVSDAIARAGFAPILLQPVNFEAMYLNRLQAQQSPAEGGVQ